MENDPFYSLFDREVRFTFTPPLARKEVLEHVVRWVTPEPGKNSVVYCHCREDQVDEIIGEQVESLTASGQPLAWIVYDHDRPASLKDRLAAHGFFLEGSEAFMVLDFHHPPASLIKPVDADVRRLTRRDQLGDIGAVMQAVWGGDEKLRERQLALELEIPGYLSVYVGYVAGKPACAGRVNFLPGQHFATLKGGCTLPEYRKYGLYTAVLAARLQEALARGYRYLVIEASPMSAPIVSKHGFEFLEYLHEFRL